MVEVPRSLSDLRSIYKHRLSVLQEKCMRLLIVSSVILHMLHVSHIVEVELETCVFPLWHIICSWSSWSYYSKQIRDVSVCLNNISPGVFLDSIDGTMTLCQFFCDKLDFTHLTVNVSWFFAHYQLPVIMLWMNVLLLKPNSITLASSELAPNMFGAGSKLTPNQLV